MPYSHSVRWDRFFEDLEDQLASEWEAERAALDTEAERLRLSRVGLRERLSALKRERGAAAEAASPTIELADGTSLSADVVAVGEDWIALEPRGALAGVVLVPISGIHSIAARHGDLLRSARPQAAPVARTLADRMGLGFVLRDLARRRVAVSAQLVGGRALAGTIDRVGADHFDLALHEPGSARRATDVTGFRLVPMRSLAWLRVEGSAGTLLG